jgi:hypothetical protein
MRWLLAVTFLCTALLAADVADMSGTWVLDVNRSKWHEKQKPNSVRITVEHQEPKLKYQGVATDANDGTRNFSFDGAIDGKEYNGVTITRLSPVSTLSVFKPENGTSQEITTTVSKDGNHLIRRIQSKGPEGKLIWTEIYDKQQQ